MPLTYLHKWLSEHTTGDDYLAAAIMNAALASKPPMRCMRWDTVSRKHVPAAFWTDHEFYQDLMRWVVGPRNPRALTIPLTNWAFYVWEPDAAKRWPALEQPADGASDAKPVKPGPKPRGNWPTLIQQWLLAVAAEIRNACTTSTGWSSRRKHFCRTGSIGGATPRACGRRSPSS